MQKRLVKAIPFIVLCERGVLSSEGRAKERSNVRRINFFYFLSSKLLLTILAISHLWAKARLCLVTSP